MGRTTRTTVADRYYGAMVREPTFHRLRRCRELLRAVKRDATMDQVLSEASTRLLRALRDECHDKGIKIPDAGEKDGRAKVAPDQIKAATESKRPMISE